MRILLDTNVLARAAAGPPGLANELVLAATRPEHVLLLTPFLVAELSRVLRYERLCAVHGLDEAGIDQYVMDLILVAEMVAVPGESPHVVADDPDDDAVVAAALTGNADVICTKDRHLLSDQVQEYCRANGVRVLEDTKLIKELS